MSIFDELEQEDMFAAMLRQQQARQQEQVDMQGRQSAAFPPLNPQERDSLLNDLLGKSIGGLEWVGQLLDKPGRAVRGTVAALQGDPNHTVLGSLANLVPFSDTVGLTDPAKAATGRTILENAGVLDQNETGLDVGDVAGFAADVALDPLTYLGGIGAMTKAGKAAAKIGKLPFAAKPAVELAAEAAKAGKLAPSIESGIRAGQRSLIDIGIPFTEMRTAIGTGEKAAKFAGDYVDPALDFLKYNKVSRNLGRLVQPWRGNMQTAKMQKLWGEGFLPELENRMLGEEMVGLHKDYREFSQAVHRADESLGRGIFSAGEDGMDGFAKSTHEETARLMTAAGEGIMPEAEAARYTSQIGHADPLLHAEGLAVKAGQGLRKLFDPMVAEAKAAGVDIAPLKDEFIDYIARYHHPDEQPGVFEAVAKSFRRKLDMVKQGRIDFLRGLPGGTNQLEDLIKNPEVFSGPEAYAIDAVRKSLPPITAAEGLNERQAQAAEIVSWIRGLPGQYHAEDGPRFFNADPMFDAILRTQKHYRQVTNANFLTEAAAQTAVKIKLREGQAAPEGFTKLLDVLDNNLLKSYPELDEAGQRIGLQGPEAKLSEHFGVDPLEVATIKQKTPHGWVSSDRTAGLVDYYIPDAYAKDFQRFISAWKNPEELAPVLRIFDAVQNLWKAGSTQIWPAFHARNIMSGAYYHTISGAAKAGHEPFIAAYNLLRNNPNVPPDVLKHFGTVDDMIAELGAAGLFRPGNTQAMEGSMRGVEPTVSAAGAALAGKPEVTGKMGKVLQNLDKAVNVGRSVGNYTENTMRIGHYVSQRMLGFSPVEARRSVAKWFFDYGDQTQAEREIFKRVFPFWSFARNNMELVLGELAKRPGGPMGQTIRAINEPRQNEGFVPSYVSEGAAIKLPGDGRYITSLGIPIESAFDPFAAGPTLKRSVERNLQGVLGMTSPVIKGTATAAFGVDPYTGRDLNELYKFPTESTLFNLAANTVAGTPLSRARTVIDDRKGPIPKVVNLLTGVKVTDLSGGEDRARQLAGRKINEQMMSESPNIRQFTDYYVPPEKRGLLTQDETDYLRLQATLQQEARKTKQQQRRAGVGSI